MTKENIIEFLRTGQLANFKFGTNQKTIVETLGDTSWTIPVSDKDNRPALIKYDQVEFYFSDDTPQSLYGIQVTYSQPGDKKNFNMEYYGLNKALNYSSLKTFLKDNNILFSERQSDYDKSETIIETQGQVIFHFSDNNTVQKFGRFLKTN